MFSLEITLGNILTVVSMAIIGLGFLFTIKSEVKLLAQALASLDRRLNTVEQALVALNQATIQLARQEVRLDSHEQRFQDIERTLDHRRAK